MTKLEKPELVAVYGTLRPGNGNNRLLREEKHLGTFTTDARYKMFSWGGFPIVALEGDNSIVCDVFEVQHMETCINLDRLEGYHPDKSRTWYDKIRIDTPYGRATMYFMPGTIEDFKELYQEIPEGDWNAFRNIAVVN